MQHGDASALCSFCIGFIWKSHCCENLVTKFIYLSKRYLIVQLLVLVRFVLQLLTVGSFHIVKYNVNFNM